VCLLLLCTYCILLLVDWELFGIVDEAKTISVTYVVDTGLCSEL